MTTGQTKGALLKENQQLRDRIETLEEVLSALYGRDLDDVDLKEIAAEARARLQLSLVVDSSDDAILTHSPDGVVESWNRAAERLFGYTAREAIGQDFRSLIIPPEDVDEVTRRFEGVRQGSVRVNHVETERLRKDGSRIPVSVVVSPIHDATGQFMGASVNIRDISERRQTEDRLHLFRTLLDRSGAVIEVIDPETLRYIDVNETACRVLGYSREELLSMSVRDVDTTIVDETRLAKIDSTLKRDRSITFESAHRRKDGSTFPVEVSLSQVRVDREYRIAVVRDISERKESEAQLQLFRALIDRAVDDIEVIDPSTMRILDVNDTECRRLGYSREELLSMTIFDIDQGLGEDEMKSMPKQVLEAGYVRFDSVHRRKDGSIFPVEVSTTRIELDKPYLLSIARDISERKRSEEGLRLANRSLKAISEVNLALVRVKGEAAFLKAVTDILVKVMGYDLAVVDYAENDPEKSIMPVAWSGMDERPEWAEKLSWHDGDNGRVPVALAIRIGGVQVCSDIPHCAEECTCFEPWKDAVIAKGYASNIAFPLADGTDIFGGLNLYSHRIGAFDRKEIQLLSGVAEALAYGVNALRVRSEHEHHTEVLQRSLEQSIETIAETLAARDPYTAGHQRRVAELATAIGREMALPEEQVNGIHLAAIIHDLGKIHVPAEILAKPGKLSEIEYALIKEHPQAGYDILRDVTFPWPIAEIVLQHHERLDGSGYPQGLKGEEILLEARIIAVADLVEAMSSHRPYRPGRGIEAALAEIEKNRGKWYDPEAVDVCLRLFREQGYKLSKS